MLHVTLNKTSIPTVVSIVQVKMHSKNYFYVSQRSTISFGATEVPSKFGWHLKALIGTMNFLSKSANASFTEIALSCASREHARVMLFTNMWKWIHIVDVDDSEAAVLLANIVSQCGDRRSSMLALTHITFDAVEMDRRGSLRLQ